MSIEWSIIFMGLIAACAHFSYVAGFNNGTADAVDSVLDTLSSAKLIKIDEDGNISPIGK
jgi:hypothetical protein